MSGSGSNFAAQPLTPHIGARLPGVRLEGRPDSGTIALIEEAIARHLVLVFDDQDLSPAALRDLTGAFGPAFLHHDDAGVVRADGVPEVLHMVKEADSHRLFGGSDWHADVTFRDPPAFLSVLHAIEVPPTGGDTAFANTISAFRALTPAMQAMLRPLRAVHSYDGPGRPDREGQTAIHPVVRSHPVSGREGLFLNRMFAVRFEGMSEAESRPLIDFLDRHMTRPEFTCRVSWKPGQVVMWDNRFTLHYPINDFTGHRRLLIRCTAMERGPGA